jgi:peptidoglycan/xylan/chitin deacetylase (PgdA/CDA1 family)
MNKMKILLFISFFIGIFCIIIGIFHDYIMGFVLPDKIIVSNYNWMIIIGFILLFIDLILLLSNNYTISKKDIKINIRELILILILIILFSCVSGWLFGQYQNTLIISTTNIQKLDDQVKMMEQMEKNNPFYNKKVIIRDDDIGSSGYLPSLKWISNLVMEKNIKITYAVLPSTLIQSNETIQYLNTLDRIHFEFATHGFEHNNFKNFPEEKQYISIKNGTRIIEENLQYIPYTFVPPYGSGDTNTTKVCRNLGYHTITDLTGYPSYIQVIMTDFEYEANYDPLEHHSFEDFKISFDTFVNSSDEYYLFQFHDWTLLNEEGNIDENKCYEFEKIINYIQSTNTQFMTIEEAYNWYVDERTIKTGMINESAYFIDLNKCSYDHTIRFNSPSKWNRTIVIKDVTSEKEVIFYDKIFEFEGEKGHLYDIFLME